MKHVMSVVAIALLLGLSGAVLAEETPADTVAAPVVQSASASTSTAPTADEWLAAQAVVLPDAIFAGEQCGGVTCPKFQYCCNPSCSRCVLYGMSCTQESCN